MQNIYLDIGFPLVSALLLETKKEVVPGILILWWLDCHLSMSSVTVITTFVVSISTYMIKQVEVQVYGVSVISWRSVLLVEETGISDENHQAVASHCQSLSNKKCCIENTSTRMGFQLISLVVIGVDCTGSCKSNYHRIAMIKQVSGFIQILIHHPQIKPIITI